MDDNSDSQLVFPGQPLLLDVKAVAEHLSISVRTVWRLRDKRLLPSVHINGRTLWRWSDVCSYVDGLEHFGGIRQGWRR